MHRSRLVSVYVRNGLERSSAEDLAAEAYATAWRRLQELPADPERATGWLFGIARHLYLNHRRSERRRAALVERLAAYDSRSSSRQPEESRVVALLIWRSLPPVDRRVLTVSIDNGAALHRLAHKLGCSYGAAATRLSRARRRLTRELERQECDDSDSN